jgi:hypothetical protein
VSVISRYYRDVSPERVAAIAGVLDEIDPRSR